jgi:SAM-dependent methyltransferase
MAVLVLSAPAGVSGQVNPADAWEKRFNDLQPPDKVMEAIGVKPGMVIGEIGAGRGRYTMHLAGKVGSAGKVYANDIDGGSLAYLRERCQRDGIGNVVTILGRMDDPLFPAGSLDMVFMINTYHHLARPVVLLRNLIPGLKPAEFQKESTSQDALRKQAADAGFEVVRVETFLEKDNIYILRAKES